MTEQNNFEALASNDILSVANDQCAAGMYRAMFRHETNVQKLDVEYTDPILNCVIGGNDTVWPLSVHLLMPYDEIKKFINLNLTK